MLHLQNNILEMIARGETLGATTDRLCHLLKPIISPLLYGNRPRSHFFAQPNGSAASSSLELALATERSGSGL